MAPADALAFWALYGMGQVLLAVHHVILVVSSFLTDRLPLRVFFLVEPVVMRGFAASQALALAARRLFNRAGSVAMASRRRR